jgi:hypothetical protein
MLGGAGNVDDFKFWVIVDLQNPRKTLGVSTLAEDWIKPTWKSLRPV